MVEDRNSITHHSPWNIGLIKPKSLPYHSLNPPPTTYNQNRNTFPIKSNPHRPENPTTFKKLTNTEIQAKREKGLCYNCDDKFTIEHKCKNKELHLLVIREIEEGEARQEAMWCELSFDHEEIDGEMNAREDKDSGPGQSVESSINFIVSLTTPGTMKLKGMLRQKEVMVLIYSGASHNFISAEVVQQLGFPLSGTTSYGIIMGIGLIVKEEYVCRRVSLRLPGLMMEEDFLLLELGSSDVILGMQ